MKSYLILILFILTNFVIAQKPLDTIYGNDTKNVALFFETPIRQGITGASNFVFTYNREKEQHFGLLQAKPGEESNLLTITGDGQVYSYILKYKDSISKLNYFISKGESIGSEKPVEIQKVSKEKPKPNSKTKYSQKFSDYLLKNKHGRIATKRKNGVKLQLQQMVYGGSEVYMVFEITNNSGIDFEVDYLKVYRVNGNKKRKASYQKLEQDVIHQYKMPNKIKTGAKKQFVYVLPKFVLGDNEKLVLELKELKGSRKVALKN